LAGFDAALAAGEDEFVKRRIYLTLERGRDIALRNLLRKVFIAGGFEGETGVRRTRIPMSEFGAAVSIGSKERMESDEVECLLANMIYKVRRCLYFLVKGRKGDIGAFLGYPFHASHLALISPYWTYVPRVLSS